MQGEHAVNLDFMGGAMEVGGSAILVEMDGRRILLDSGIRQKAGADPLPDFRRIQERGGVDAIVISHAHMDHTGTLPIISKEYPSARIYATSMTIDLTRVLLYDSIKIMARQEEGIPVYAQKDVEQVFDRMLAVGYEQEMEILPGIILTLFQAGHIAGAACVYLQSRDGSLFYSGDFSSFSQNTIEGIRIPKLRPDIAIVESTYGDRLHSNRQVEERQLVLAAAECIEKQGKMLIPVFALGRAQEVLLILRRAMNKGELPKVKIYVDGMVREINTAYLRNPWFLKKALAKRIEKGNDVFYSEDIIPVGPKDDRQELIKASGPAIFVASSGMLTGGPSTEYAKQIAPMENGCIAITGYQDEEAPGRQILELLEASTEEERFLAVGGGQVPVRCQLKKVGLSAHGDKGEIESLLEQLSARNVFLVHGDGEVISVLAAGLQLDYRTRIFTPRTGDFEKILLKSPRKQMKKSFPFTMQRVESPEGREKEFYDHLQEHYPGRKFTVTDMAFIWYGRDGQSESALEGFQKVILASRYFARDDRRLYLFVCRSREELWEEEQKNSIMTNQQLQQAAEECFTGFPYRKISFYNETKEISLQFDFPREVEEEFPRAAGQFEEKTGWRATKNLEPNEHAIQMLLQQYLGTAIQKISIKKMESSVTVRLGRVVEENILQELVHRFEGSTGYLLFFDGLPGERAVLGRSAQSGGADTGKNFGGGMAAEDDSFFYPPKGGPAQEQNLAISCIDAAFSGEKVTPYKKSIITDNEGKYIQLSFLSPALGHRQGKLLRELAGQIGWRIRIASSVNQNGITAYAVQCCQRHGVELAKIPSYQPGAQRLVLRPSEEYQGIEKVCAEITEETGICCVAERK